MHDKIPEISPATEKNKVNNGTCVDKMLSKNNPRKKPKNNAEHSLIGISHIFKTCTLYFLYFFLLYYTVIRL